MNWTKDSIAEELKLLPVWRKRFYTWPIHRQAYENPSNYNILNECVRLSMSTGIAIYPQPSSAIDFWLNMIKQHQYPFRIEWTVSATPYHYAKTVLNTNGADDPFNWGEAHEKEMDFYTEYLTSTLVDIVTKQKALGLSNKVGMIFLDTECDSLIITGDTNRDFHIKQKFNMIHLATRGICNQILKYIPKIVWYNQYAASLAGGSWFNPNIVHPDALSDAGSVALYQLEDPFLCVTTYNKSSQNTTKPMIPVVCLNGGYNRHFHQWTNSQQNELVKTEDLYPRVNSWLMGRYIQWSAWGQPEAEGNFERAPYGIFWPGFCEPNWKYWPLHFLSFAYGCNNTHKIPEGDIV